MCTDFYRNRIFIFFVRIQIENDSSVRSRSNLIATRNQAVTVTERLKERTCIITDDFIWRFCTVTVIILREFLDFVDAFPAFLDILFAIVIHFSTLVERSN